MSQTAASFDSISALETDGHGRGKRNTLVMRPSFFTASVKFPNVSKLERGNKGRFQIVRLLDGGRGATGKRKWTTTPNCAL